MRRNERDLHGTDHGKRAELQRAETEEVELLVVLIGSRLRDWASIHPCLPDAARAGGRSRALDNEKLMFSFLFSKKSKTQENNLKWKPKASNQIQKTAGRSPGYPEPCFLTNETHQILFRLPTLFRRSVLDINMIFKINQKQDLQRTNKILKN